MVANLLYMYTCAQHICACKSQTVRSPPPAHLTSVMSWTVDTSSVGTYMYQGGIHVPGGHTCTRGAYMYQGGIHVPGGHTCTRGVYMYRGVHALDSLTTTALGLMINLGTFQPSPSTSTPPTSRTASLT